MVASPHVLGPPGSLPPEAEELVADFSSRDCHEKKIFADNRGLFGFVSRLFQKAVWLLSWVRSNGFPGHFGVSLSLRRRM
jgi:hypothetical protein